MAVYCALSWWMRTWNHDLRVAWFGWSPIGYVYRLAYPANFARDFAGGVETYDTSALMALYRVAYTRLGIAPERLLPGVIACEVLLLAVAVYVLSRVVRPEVPRAVGALAAMVVVGSWARDVDLARFGKPVFDGLFYNIADALRILAIAMAVRGRFEWAGLLLALSFVTHPVLALLGGVFIAAMLVREWRELPWRRVAGGALLFLGVAAGWAIAMLGPSVNSTREAVPRETWVTLTKFMGFHWYPVEYGIFTAQHTAHFIPFLSLLTLAAYYAGPPHAWSRIDRKLVAGSIAMAGLVAFGVAASALFPAPILVKLALHRASLLIALVALLYVTPGLWRDIEGGARWRRLVALAVLVSPFISKPGFPALLSLVLVAPAWVATLRGDVARRNVAVVLLSSVGIVLIATYALAGLADAWTANAYTGFRALGRLVPRSGRIGMWLVVGTALALLLRSVPLRWVRLAAGVVLVYAAGLWLLDQRMGREEVARDREYEEVQLWARDHTPADALFMTDPTIYYGWRDYSRRSSFGNLREWLYSGWAYTSSATVYAEGLKRFDELGVDLRDYLRAPDAFLALKGFGRLSRAVERRYYTVGDDWRLDLARRYGIDYFVVRKDRLATTHTGLRVVFANKRFLVMQSELVGPALTWRPVWGGDAVGVADKAWSTYSEARPVTWPWGVTPDGFAGTPGVYLTRPDAREYWLYTSQGPITEPPSGSMAGAWRVEKPGTYRVSAYLKGRGSVEVEVWWYDGHGRPARLSLERSRLPSEYELFMKAFELPPEARSFRVALSPRGGSWPSTVFVDDLVVEREELARDRLPGRPSTPLAPSRER